MRAYLTSLMWVQVEDEDEARILQAEMEAAMRKQAEDVMNQHGLTRDTFDYVGTSLRTAA